MHNEVGTCAEILPKFLQNGQNIVTHTSSTSRCTKRSLTVIIQLLNIPKGCTIMKRCLIVIKSSCLSLSMDYLRPSLLHHSLLMCHHSNWLRDLASIFLVKSLPFIQTLTI